MSASLPRFLLFGHDTVECAYYLRTDGGGLDFDDLARQREDLRQAKERSGKAIRLGNGEFLLAPNGTGSGYPFLMTCPEFSISFGEFNDPSFFVKFSSTALWREGAEVLHQRFLGWAESVGVRPYKNETLSRVDFTFDYHLPVVDFEWDSFVSDSKKNAQHRNGQQAQTFGFGSGDILLRVYDKVAEIEEESHKTWFFDLWGRRNEVWRIEWQVRKTALRRFGIRSFADLADQEGDLLTYLAESHDTLRQPSADGNRSRWPLHPMWRDLQGQIAGLGRQGVLAEIEPARAIDERLARIAISLYGYAKRIAALDAIKRSVPTPGIDDTMGTIMGLIGRIHDPLTWKADVRRRIDEERLRPW